jgi:peptidoglycan/xylan/chitin deacetylase (PgdA/CDA1 family)
MEGVATSVHMEHPRAALSIDVEFFSHIPAYRNVSDTTDQTAVGSEGVDFLIDIFNEFNTNGTFFIITEIVDTHTELIKKLAKQHEIGSHTHTHRHLSELTQAERRRELEVSKRRLESIRGTNVNGFRAPSFDFAEDHFDLLGNTGYRYDSSVNPCRSIPGWYGGVYEIKRPVPAREINMTAPARLAEIPVAVMPGLGLPLTGTWIRFFGVYYTLLGMKLLARRGIVPVLYIHPWELVDLPAVEGIPDRVYWRTGDYMRRAVRHILNTDFEFISVGQLAEEIMIESGDAPS